MAVVWNSSHAKFGVVLLPKTGESRAKHYQGCALAKHMLRPRVWGLALMDSLGCLETLNLHRNSAVELNLAVESF